MFNDFYFCVQDFSGESFAFYFLKVEAENYDNARCYASKIFKGSRLNGISREEYLSSKSLSRSGEFSISS